MKAVKARPPRAPSVPSLRLRDGGGRTPGEEALGALLARLPPAEADDHAVDRVWHAMTAVPRIARDASRLGLRLRLLGVALAALVVGVLSSSFWRSAPPVPRSIVEVTLSSGGVFAARGADVWHPSRDGEVLAESDRLRTDPAAQALVRIRGVAALLVGQASDIALERLSSGTALRLARGTVTARVSKRAPGEPFVVEAGPYRVTVVGTLFSVEAGPGERAAVSVREGVVEVATASGPIARVVAGGRWTSEAPTATGADHTADGVASLLEKGLRGGEPSDLAADFGSVLKSGFGTTPVASSSAPSSFAPASPPVLPGRTVTAAASAIGPPSPRLARVADVPPAVPVAERALARSPVLNVDGGPVEPASGAPPAGSFATAAPISEAARQGSPIDAYAHAVAREEAGDAEGAARELAEVAERDPLHGDLALYSLGRLAYRRLHDPARALGAFRRYRERYPQGALLPEVDFEILQLDVEAHDRSRALADAARFLAVHPGSERQDEVHLLRADLLRDAGRCGEALPEYAAVRASLPADHALYSTAYCQRKLGDRSGAGRTLTEYVRRFPQGAHRADALRALESERAGETGTQN